MPPAAKQLPSGHRWSLLWQLTAPKGPTWSAPGRKAGSARGRRNSPCGGVVLLAGHGKREKTPQEVKASAQRPSDRDRHLGDRGADCGAGNGSQAERSIEPDKVLIIRFVPTKGSGARGGLFDSTFGAWPLYVDPPSGHEGSGPLSQTHRRRDVFRTSRRFKKDWRRRPESNWGWRFCKPLPCHLATSPRREWILPSAAYLAAGLRPSLASSAARAWRDLPTAEWWGG